jgi:hypothetical protein
MGVFAVVACVFDAIGEALQAATRNQPTQQIMITLYRSKARRWFNICGNSVSATLSFRYVLNSS